MSSDKYIPNKMLRFTPYVPVACDGKDVIHMEANESPFDLPDEVKKEIAEKLFEINFNRYPDPSASKLCKAFASFYGIDEKNVAAGNGSDELIMILTAAFLQNGDRIAVTSPDFSMYGFYPALFENNICVFEKGKDLLLDLDAFSSFIKENGCKAAIFSEPCNPTGVRSADRGRISRFAANTDALIILDEAYMDFSSGGFINEVCDHDNMILLKTLSKGFGLASARLGFAIGKEKLINVIKTAKSPYNVNSISQMIGETVLAHKDMLLSRHKEIVKQRDRIYDVFVSMGYNAFKSETNFVFVKTKKAKQICEAMKQNGIIIKMFPSDALRITAGSEKETDKFIKVLEKA